MNTIAHAPTDPTRVGLQPALQTARRRQWLVPAGLLAAIAVGIFALTIPLNPAISLTGIVLDVLFYAAMLVCAATVPQPRGRNLAFAWLMGGLAVTSALLLLLLLAIEQIT
ncbi:hypothetical protein AAIB33_11095 [Microbacterium sp. AZCO]|uniref:hypothetical protein n=1 Tax=Microbacterium sp. AZCO TaxID=3142976 RepID=UPI0031F37CCC